MSGKTDRFKQKIMDKAGGNQQRYLYRGNDIEKLVDEVRTGTVRGGEHDIYTGEMMGPPQDPVGTLVEDLPWDPMNDDLSVETVSITGGFASSLAQTHRFNGSMNTSAIIKDDGLGLKEIEYTYDFYNDNPGVYAHVRSSTDGEIRETQPMGAPDLGRLTGFVKKKIKAGGERRLEVGGYSPQGDLPGTSSNSLVAQETEWVAARPEVSIAGSVEGFVTVIEPLSARVRYADGKDMVPGDAPPATEILPEAFAAYNDPIPAGMEHYMLIVGDFQDYQNTDYGGWRVGDITAAYNTSGEVSPQNVPNHYRGDSL